MFWKKVDPVLTDTALIDELLTRGVDEVLPNQESLRSRLLSGQRLRVKLGFDPTGERIHVGHSAPLLKLRDFQRLGHTVVFIVGDFTAVIGDTSDKESERPMLEAEAIRRNMATWKEQVSKILDLSKAEFRYNAEWLGKLTYREIGEHADNFSVADFIARDNIRRRLDQGKRVSLREVLYPLMQGYDSVAVQADVEIGGTDQKFNLLAGRTLQTAFKQRPQEVLTMALLTDSTGKKMSKTGGATVFVTDEPNEMFGKTMTVPDELVRQYFVSMTRIPLAEVASVMELHPKEAKVRLAETLVSMYHGKEVAIRAREHFENTFSKGEVPVDIPVLSLGDGSFMHELVLSGAVESNAAFRRLVSQGAVRIAETDEKITEHSLPPFGSTVRIGKHKFYKIVKK